MASVQFVANQAGLTRLLQGANGPVALFVANKGRQAEGAARRIVPRVSGALAGSISSLMARRSSGDWGFDLWARSPYATWIHDGRRFDPRSGRIIFVRVGPRPFLRDALNAVDLPLSRRG